METGWIWLHRKIREHWIWNDPVKLKWWLDILMQVNHDKKTVKVNVGLNIIECKRGQTVMSLQHWAERWNVSKGCARHFLDLLQKDNMILRENVKKSTRITVCNYDTYNGGAHDRETIGKRSVNDRETIGDPNNNDLITINNENNDNNPSGGNNFFESIVFLFKEIYEEIKCIPYAVTKKDYSAAGEVVKLTKDASGITEEEKLKENLQAYFRQVIDHPDKFQKEHMTLSYLANNFNTVNNTFQSKSGGDINSFIKRIAKNQGIEIPQDGVWNRDTRTASEKTYFADNRTPPQPPNFIEVEKYFAENGRSTWEANRAYEHFNKWNWKNKAGESIISRWEEVASMLFFPGGKLYKSEFSTGKKVTM